MGETTKIDWLQAKTDYIKDPTVSLRDLAKKYGVADSVMMQRSADEGWVKQREEVRAKAEQRLSEKLPETIAEVKDRHAKIGKTLQGRGLEVIATRKPETFEEARLSVLAGIKIEREALGLNTDEVQNVIYQKFQQFSFIFNLKPDELQRFIDAIDARLAVLAEGSGQTPEDAGSTGGEGEQVGSATVSG